ncbi:hypothetical protein L3Q82_002935 [Scortum barcoo]|uniref:Uncharacterized protein n=1 Tax=Scortum barcoo TaxID=214431 RepID=A0ACB8VW48_9TELE|nr:hypothetical protein L3Q82_002935 [Scortum barcoo]
MEELSAKFHGSTDLRQGYLQVPLHPDSRNLTAFVCFSHGGFPIHPYALWTQLLAPSCFQKIMATIFAGILGVVVYLDDIVVHRGTATIHDQCLSRVLDVLAHHNLTLNGEKCVFAAPVIEFVGFRLSTSGLSPLHSNVDAILRLPEPSCPTQLSSFLGMTAFYLCAFFPTTRKPPHRCALSLSWMHPGRGPLHALLQSADSKPSSLPRLCLPTSTYRTPPL